VKNDDPEVEIGNKDQDQEIINRPEMIDDPDQLMSETRKLKDDQEVDREVVDEIEEEDDMTHQALAHLHRRAVRQVQAQEVVHGDHDHVTQEGEKTILLPEIDGVHSNEKEDLCLKLPSTKIK